MRGGAIGAAVAATPVVFDFFGYHFQAGPLVVGVAGVVIARQMAGVQTGKPRRWGLEITVAAFCLFLTALVVQDVRSLLFAGLVGLGIGGAGVVTMGIIREAAVSRLRATISAALGVPMGPPPAPQDDDPAAIDAAVETLNREE